MTTGRSDDRRLVTRRGTGSAAPVAVPLLLVAVVLIAFNLRSPFVTVPPVAGTVRAALHLSAPQLGLLTSLPVLCFGLAAPFALLLIRRIGAERSVFACLGGVVVALVLRSSGGFALAIAATVLLGVAITIGNVVVPVLIRQELPATGRALATGVYTAGLNIGAMVATLATVPIAELAGWRVATAVWTVFGILAGAVWAAVLLRARRAPRPTLPMDELPMDEPPVAEPPVDERPAPEPPAPERRHDLRDPLPWLLALAFSAQAFSYYGVTAWLPTLLRDERGLSAAVAGNASAVFQGAAVVGGLAVPLLARRLQPWQVLLAIGLTWCVLPIGLLAAPEGFLVWSFIGGMAQGGGFSAIFGVIVRVARDGRHSTFLSAFVQSVGYVVAAVAPPLLGAVHEATDSWTAPMIAVLVATALLTVLGVTAAALSSGTRHVHETV